MELYLLRHGIAVERGTHPFRNDSHRPLTPEGMKRTRRVARALKKLKFHFDRILSSPYVRAKQTADIVADELGIHSKLRLCHALVPGGAPRELIADLKRSCEGDARVLLIGHEPGLSRLASLLISGKADADITLKKAGLCVLEAGELTVGRCASLELLVPPRRLLHMVD